MSIINTVIKSSKGNIDMDSVVLEYDKEVEGIRVTVNKSYPYKPQGKLYSASTEISSEIGDTDYADEALEHIILKLTETVREKIRKGY